MPLDPQVGAAAIQSGGGLFGGIFGLVAQNKQNKANMELAKYAYKKDLEMWNRGNAYNSPQAQMQRLEAAGLNKALVYGNGAVAGQSAGSLPKYNAPTLDYSYVPPVEATIAGALDTYQNFRVKQAQVDNLKAQNKILMETGRIREKEADNASRYFFNKSWKMHDDRNISQSKGMDLDRTLVAKERSGFYGKSFQYQLEGMDAANRAKEMSITKMQTDMDYKAKQLEYYLVNLLGPYASKAIGMFLPKGGSKPMTKVPSFNQKQRSNKGSSYTSPKAQNDLFNKYAPTN